MIELYTNLHGAEEEVVTLPIHSHHTRTLGHSLKLNLGHFKAHACRQSTVKLWHSLLQDVVIVASLNGFKGEIGQIHRG